MTDKIMLSPKVCFTGNVKAGSWQIRGEQISSERSNWAALPNPSRSDFVNFDVLCVVKKLNSKIVSSARDQGLHIVYDIVDSWRQPRDGLKCHSVEDARVLFRKKWKKIDADLFIFPTEQMLIDLGDLVPKGQVIYHHYRPGIPLNPIRDQVLTVGYEGADFLGEWKSRLEESCRQMGVTFVTNPLNYSDIDVVVLARGGLHANFLSHRYKSNVKLANAYGSGTPALVHIAEQSAHDTDCGNVLYFSDIGSFDQQLDLLINNLELRRSISNSFLLAAKNYEISSIAKEYEDMFSNLVNQL